MKGDSDMFYGLSSVQFWANEMTLSFFDRLEGKWSFVDYERGDDMVYKAVEHKLSGDYFLHYQENCWVLTTGIGRGDDKVAGFGEEVEAATKGNLPRYVFPDDDLSEPPYGPDYITGVELRSDGVVVRWPHVVGFEVREHVHRWTEHQAIRWLLYALLNGTMVPDSGAREFVFSGDDGAEPDDARAPQTS